MAQAARLAVHWFAQAHAWSRAFVLVDELNASGFEGTLNDLVCFGVQI